MRARAVEPRERNAQRRGDDHVHHDGDDDRAGALRAQQRHEQRHAHEAGVGEGGHQGAKGRVVPANARTARGQHGTRHHDQRAQQVHAGHGRVEQLRDGRAGAKAVEHARQGEIQHEGIEPRNGRLRQHAAPRGQVTAEHEREEGEGDEEDGEHGGIVVPDRRSGLHGAGGRLRATVMHSIG